MARPSGTTTVFGALALIAGLFAAWWALRFDATVVAPPSPPPSVPKTTAAPPDRPVAPPVLEPAAAAADGTEAPAPAAPTARAWTLHLHIRDADGRPPKFAPTIVVVSSGGDVERLRFQREDLDPAIVAAEGTVRVHVLAYGRAPWRSPALEPPATADPRVLDAVLEPGLAVEGVLLRPDGLTPVSDGRLRVRVDPSASGDPLPAVGQGAATDDRGRFRLAGLEPGTVTVIATARQDGAATLFEARAGDAGLRVVLAEPCGVDIVPFDQGTGFAPETTGMEVLEIDTDGSESVRMTTSTSPAAATGPREPVAIGRLALLPGQPVRLRLRADGYRDSDPVDAVWRPAGGVVTARVPLVRDAGGLATVVLLLRCEGGPPPATVLIRRHHDGGWTGRAHDVVNGEVALTLPARPVRISVAPTGEEAGPGRMFLPAELDLEPERGGRLERTVVLPPAGGLTLRQPEGLDLAGKTVRLVDAGGNERTERLALEGSDANGVIWVLPPLAPGKWTVHVEQADGPATYIVTVVADVWGDCTLHPADPD